MEVKDLLNKIANSEEVPKKIKYNEYIYSYVDRNKLFAKYIREPFNAKIPYYLFTDVASINDEIEIIEEEKDKEIERLNNIINELEKWLEDYIKLFDKPDILEEQTCEDLKEVLDKLQELKGSGK